MSQTKGTESHLHIKSASQLHICCSFPPEKNDTLRHQSVHVLMSGNRPQNKAIAQDRRGKMCTQKSPEVEVEKLLSAFILSPKFVHIKQ